MPSNVIIDKIKAEISRIRTLAENGWEWREVAEAVQGFLIFLVDLLRSVNLDGVDKKALAMDSVAKLFDQLAPMIPLPWWLVIFRKQVTAALRAVVLQIADGVIERIYSHLKQSPIPEPEIQ